MHTKTHTNMYTHTHKCVKSARKKRSARVSDGVISCSLITSISIPTIWKKKYHSLYSTAALVNNPSLGATSESPAWSRPGGCHVSSEGRGLLREERMRRRKKGEKGEELCILAYSCIITGIPLNALLKVARRGYTGAFLFIVFFFSFLFFTNNQNNQRIKTFQEINGIQMACVLKIWACSTIKSKLQPHCVPWTTE